ncbi:MAG: glutathione S-transferase family protein [Alphaproteobacteria bacterium]|nr:glutathione S-transferase family protein [Alphaproteobacteria bacterium]
MLKIWGRDTSSNVQKPLWAAEELGLTYERIDVGGPFAGLDKPEFIALNPNRKIPVIDHDGFILWESNAVTRYLAGLDGTGKLWPAAAHERALADQWMDWCNSHLWPVFPTVIVGLLRTAPEKRDNAAIEQANEILESEWAVLDRQLAKTPYVAGDSFSVGDIPAGVFAWRRYELPVKRNALPNLDAWYARLRERAAYQKIVMTPLS